MGRLDYHPRPTLPSIYSSPCDRPGLRKPAHPPFMPRLLINLNALTAAALLSMAVGCLAPPLATDKSKPFGAAQKPADDQSHPSPATETATTAADDATVATVMKEVQQISADDPAAGKMLLDELSLAEPKLWPLVVQQFRSRQAFHEELATRQKSRPVPKSAKAKDTLAAEPPSAEVGKLADPRGLRPDPALEQAFAAATPANMPAPLDEGATEATLVADAAPAAFADDASARQITRSEQGAGSKAHVVLTAATETGGVEQALFNVESKAPVPSDPAGDWQAHLNLAIADLNNHLADGPRSTAEVHQLVSLRLMQLLAGDTEVALRPIPNVSSEEQDYWSGQIFALATFLDHHRQPDDDRRAAASVVHLDEAVGHLRELGSLSLRNLAFCKNVYGYGAYEPINNPSFALGQQITLYLEVENYHSESTPKGYATNLGASYEITNDAGERVANGEFPNVEDSCQSRRRDFHIQYGLVLPKSMSPGKYRLQLVMKDRQSDKIGQASIGFEVAGK